MNNWIIFSAIAMMTIGCNNGAQDDKNDRPYPLTDTNKPPEIKNMPIPPQDSARTRDSLPTH